MVNQLWPQYVLPHFDDVRIAVENSYPRPVGNHHFLRGFFPDSANKHNKCQTLCGQSNRSSRSCDFSGQQIDGVKSAMFKCRHSVTVGLVSSQTKA